jgi:serine protease Do
MKRNRSVLILASIGIAAVNWFPVALGDAPAAEDVEIREAIDRAVSRVYPALVRIHVVTVQAFGGRLQKFQGSGSGVIITTEGHVITNHHVAGNAKRIVCRMPDGEEIEAELVGTDALADIAVAKLKLDQRKNPDQPLPVGEFGDSDGVRVGDAVLAMGSPVALSQSVTKGIVSNTAMILPRLFGSFRFRLDGEDVGLLVRWIGHDAPIYGGNSGGPLVNLEGEIIGINEVGIGLSGAIPGNLAKSVADALIKTGEVTRSWIGLECQPRLKGGLDEKGVLVGGVIGGSPAQKAGIEPGDIIVTYDGVEVDCRIHEDLPLWNRLVLSTPVGKSVAVVAKRGEQTMEFEFATISRERARGKDEELKAWGMTVRNFTMMSALERKRTDKKGVLVQSLKQGGPAAEAKPALSGGDVILEVDGKTVENVADLRAVTGAATKDREKRVPVLTAFERQTQKMLTVVKVGKESPEDRPSLSRKAWLSAATQVLTKDLAKALGIKGKKGVRVTQIYPGRSAEQSGMKVGDVLLKLDGDRIDASEPEDVEVLPNLIRQYKIGSEAAFEAWRDGETLEITVTLEEPPTPPSELRRYEDDNFELTVRELSFRDRVAKQLEEQVRGVLVDRVEPAGWAALAHVRVGDVLLSIDDEPTQNVDSVERILKAAQEKKSKRVTLFVKRGIHTIYLELEPDWGKAE